MTVPTHPAERAPLLRLELVKGQGPATYELGPRDAVFIPETGQYEILSFSGSATALLGVAPRYLP